MSERNPFSKFFDKDENSDDSAREDIIPVGDPFSSLTEENKEEKSSQADEAVSENIQEEKKEDKEEITDNIPPARFIKTGNTPFISAKPDGEPEIPTAATKYTDRLLPKMPERKTHTGYTGKINTYTANHSPAPGSVKFIPADSGEPQQTKTQKPEQTPENTAEPQTRLTPTEITPPKEDDGDMKVIVEKLPEKQTVSDKTKPIASKGDLLREIAKSSGTSSEEIPEEDDDQLIMDGFSENPAEEQSISGDDEELEKELSEVRQKRIRNFRFWTKSAVETGESEDKSFSAPKEEKKLPEILEKISAKFAHLNTDFVPVDSDEYTDPSRRREIFTNLIGIRKSVIFRCFALALTGIILLIVNISASISATMHNGFFTVFGGSAVIYNCVNLFLLLIAGILMASDLKKGLFSLLKIRPKTDSALLFMYIGALAQNIAAFFSSLKPESEYHLISGAAVLLCVPVFIAKIFYYDSTRQCFKAVAAASDKSYLRRVSDTSLIASLLKDSSNTETNVVYTGKTRFISGFLKRSATAAYAGQASSRATVLTLALSVISGLIGLILTKSPVYALGCLTATAAFSFPVSCLVFTGYLLRGENTVLSVKASYVQTYSDAHTFCCVDDIIADGSDIFSAEIVSSSCNKNVSVKQAEFCAAALTNKADGILKDAFAVFAAGYQDKFPEVESLVFEDRLGFSAWISDCRILLGTKDFLISHNVELPEENSVPFVLQDNEKPLFLAIEGHFAAVFTVKYSCNPTAAKSFRELTKNGTNVLISIKDPNINEEFAEQLLGLPMDSLRIIKNSTNEKFLIARNTVTDCEEPGIVFSDSFDAFSRTMASAIKLDKAKRVSKLLTEAAAIAGAVFGVILCVAGATAGLNSYLPVILQFFWIFSGFVLTPMLSATSLKERIKLPENITEKLRHIPDADMGDDTREAYYDNEEDEEEETEVSEKDNKQENDFPAPPSFTDNSVEEPSKDAQMIMEGAPYTEPPEVIDFSLITGEEDNPEEKTEKTVSDDILDAFAGDTHAKKNRAEKTGNKAARPSGKSRFSLFDRFGSASQEQEEVSDRRSSKRKAEKQPFSDLHDGNMPPPPKYELGVKEDKKEEDPLEATFVPPETDSASAMYTDDFFASYDTAEDDKAFEDVRRRRKQEEDDDIFNF